MTLCKLCGKWIVKTRDGIWLHTSENNNGIWCNQDKKDMSQAEPDIKEEK
jgi:hypothetical protein